MIGMNQLDDSSFLHSLDPQNMAGLTAGFGAQCRRALEIARSSSLPSWNAKPDHVVLTGLGGSAAGGDLVSAYFAEMGTVPFLVNRGYSVPAYVGAGSLVFVCSYSGNTEETIAAYLDARRKGASLIVVTSGGAILEMARNDGFPVVVVPGGQPPRTAMGNMMIPVFVACEQLGLIQPVDFEEGFAAVDRVANECGFDAPLVSNVAKKCADFLSGKMAVLYGASPWSFALAQRWRGQLNENSKAMVMTHFFPELCHNEILGWEGSQLQSVEEWATVLLAGGEESERMKARIGFTLDAIGGETKVMEICARSQSLFAKMLELAHIGDWVSLYLAALNKKDPGQMAAIDTLKASLAALDS